MPLQRGQEVRKMPEMRREKGVEGAEKRAERAKKRGKKRAKGAEATRETATEATERFSSLSVVPKLSTNKLRVCQGRCTLFFLPFFLNNLLFFCYFADRNQLSELQ
jgi:hypothetical protein